MERALLRLLMFYQYLITPFIGVELSVTKNSVGYDYGRCRTFVSFQSQK